MDEWNVDGGCMYRLYMVDDGLWMVGQIIAELWMIGWIMDETMDG